MLASCLQTLAAIVVGGLTVFALTGFTASAALPLVLRKLDEQTDD